MAVRPDLTSPGLLYPPEQSDRLFVVDHRIGDQVGGLYVELIEDILQTINFSNVFKAICIKIILAPVILLSVYCYNELDQNTPEISYYRKRSFPADLAISPKVSAIGARARRESKMLVEEFPQLAQWNL